MAVVVVDIDGVVADVTHRLHHVTNLQPNAKPDWDTFFDLSHLDAPIPIGVQLVRALATEHRIHLLSGRAERIRGKTEAWLAQYSIAYEALWLRPEGDRRPDFIFKGEVLDRLRRQEEVVLVVDDSERIVEAALQRGIPALHVRRPGVERDRSIAAWTTSIGRGKPGRRRGGQSGRT